MMVSEWASEVSLVDTLCLAEYLNHYCVRTYFTSVVVSLDFSGGVRSVNRRFVNYLAL